MDSLEKQGQLRTKQMLGLNGKIWLKNMS
jgi:hypothetical protein